MVPCYFVWLTRPIEFSHCLWTDYWGCMIGEETSREILSTISLFRLFLPAIHSKSLLTDFICSGDRTSEQSFTSLGIMRLNNCTLTGNVTLYHRLMNDLLG